MPRLNRSEICAYDDVQAFHLINRCVRRTYLCGKDRRSGKDFSHRKQWIRDRLEVLAGIFGIEILGFAVMSNHLHVVARTRPDVVKAWSDDEVALRWWRLFPQRRLADHSPAEPTEFELNMIRNDATRLSEKRKRLSDVSWFMRCLAEPIARQGNKEDKVTGRFWEGRFRAQPLLDEAAIAACMVYVDLNPIRAGIAATPETSDFTSVKERIADRQAASQETAIQEATVQSNNEDHQGTGIPARRETSPLMQDATAADLPPMSKSGWLAPIPLEPVGNPVQGPSTKRRTSDKGCLPMSLDEYLSLVDWTGRQYRKDKTGKIPEECLPIFQRLRCDGETWMDWVKKFRQRFRNEVGRPASCQAFKEARHYRRATVTSS
jgi:REP element-mobilizing transposase RayT